jgi:hypothetical protein
MGAIRLLLAGVAGVAALLATLPVLLVGAPFWIASALTRAVQRGVGRLFIPDEAPRDVIEFTPEIGWKNRGGVRCRVHNVQSSFRVTTDGEGWRGRRSIEDSDVVVFGDSFAFGEGIDDRHHFAELPSAVRIKAVGATGYNMVQSLLWMERLRARLRGRLVVWLAFYGNDPFDNLHPSYRHYRTPFVRRAGRGDAWEVAASHVRPDPWPFPCQDRDWGYADKAAEIHCPSHHAERAYSACEYLLERARETCAGAGADLVVVGVPCVEALDSAGAARLREQASDPGRFDPGLPDRRFAEICGRLEIRFAALSTVLSPRDHIHGDVHWTRGGHARVARVLEELYGETRTGARARPLSVRAKVPAAAGPVE